MLSPLYDEPEDKEPKKEDLEEGLDDFGDNEDSGEGIKLDGGLNDDEWE